MFYQDLEKEFSRFTGYKYAVALNSGTSALHLALLAMGVKAGDEVIVPDLTFASCAFAVSYCGATPVFVDCDDTLNIDVSKIEEKITKNTKVIMGVHVYGRRCDMESIRKIAKKYKLKVLEDLSEGHGIQPTGDIAIYSFQSSKVIHCEEGGILVTNNYPWAKEASLRKTLANEGNYYHPIMGFNYRMADSQAKLALESLRKFKNNIKKRRKVEANLSKTFGVQLYRDVPWVFDLICKTEEERANLLLQIPGSRYFFKPLSSLPMYKQKVGPNALKFSKLGLIIPIKI